jgi:hypothetical protein
MTSKDQAERLRVLLEGIRNPKDTMHHRTQFDDRGGRYAAIGKPMVVGTSPIAYPKISSGPWSEGLDQVSSPEPLVDQTDCGDTYVGEPLGSPAEIEATSAPSPHSLDAQTLGAVRIAPSPPVSKSPTHAGGVPTFKSEYEPR